MLWVRSRADANCFVTLVACRIAWLDAFASFRPTSADNTLTASHVVSVLQHRMSSGGSSCPLGRPYFDDNRSVAGPAVFVDLNF